MKLKSNDINALLNDNEEMFVESKNATKDINVISNRVQRIRNSVAVKHEDNKVYGNKDKTRIKY